MVAKTIIPALVNGDHMDADEFHRRYAAMPGVRKAELLDGVVYMPSPTRDIYHGKPHGQMASILGYFAIKSDGVVSLSDNSTLKLGGRNEAQPDLMLTIEQGFGGISHADSGGYRVGPVELAVEISASTIGVDTRQKRDIYERVGVAEYWVWSVDDNGVIFLTSVDGTFVPINPDEHGIIRSRVFPGLWLDVPALLAHKLLTVLATLDRGIASPEHKAFMAKLAARKV